MSPQDTVSYWIDKKIRTERRIKIILIALSIISLLLWGLV